jgi:hypothetical protein
MGEAAEDAAIMGTSPDDARLLTHQAVDLTHQAVDAFVRPPAFHGRAVSWTEVTIVVIGFIAGGLALVLGPTWWLFWAAAALVAVGSLMALATNIFEDWY